MEVSSRAAKPTTTNPSLTFKWRQEQRWTKTLYLKWRAGPQSPLRNALLQVRAMSNRSSGSLWRSGWFPTIGIRGGQQSVKFGLWKQMPHSGCGNKRQVRAVATNVTFGLWQQTSSSGRGNKCHIRAVATKSSSGWATNVKFGLII